MYCSSCGTAVMPGLSYCNRCGAGLNAREAKAMKRSEVAAEHLVWAIVSVSVGGLGVILALMALMKQALNFSVDLIALFSLLSFLLLIGAESVFIWQLLRSKASAKKAGDITHLNESATRELDAAHGRALPEPAPSVTEQTTRAFEPVSLKRKTE